MSLSNVHKVAKHYGNLIVEQAQLELGTRRYHKSGKGRTYTGRKVSSGDLRKNLNVIISEQKGKFSLKFGAKGAAAKYAYFVHNGRKKNSTPPPIQELVNWMKKKGMKPRDKKTGAFKPYGEDDKNLVSMAIPIAKSIGKYGIPAFPYYRMALKKYDTEMGDALLDALELDVNIAFDKEGL